MDDYEKMYNDIINDTESMLRYLFTNDKRKKDSLKKDKKTIKKFKKRFDENGIKGLFEE
jgi:Na+/phosphate symporter